MTESNDGAAGRRLRRRGFLLGGAGAALAAGAYVAAHESDEAPRAQVPGDGYVNLATFLLAAHPPEVRAAIERHRRGLDANAALYLREHEEGLEFAAREAAAGHLGAEAYEIALTDSTTMGLALVYGGLRLAPGDEVVTTEHDFYATHEALRLRSERDGVPVRRVQLYSVSEEASADGVASAIERALGPRGTGIVWAAPHAWERIAPLIPSFDPRAYFAWLEGERPDDGVPPGPLMTPGGYHSFEHRWALTHAFEHHAGLGDVAGTTYALAARMKQGLTQIPGVAVKTPAADALSSGLVCAEVSGAPAGEVVDRLREEHRVVASVTPYAQSYVRFGPSVANSDADVDRALEAVAAVVG